MTSAAPISVSDEWQTARAAQCVSAAIMPLRRRPFSDALLRDLAIALTNAVQPYPARRYDYQIRRLGERDWTVEPIRRVGWV